MLGLGEEEMQRAKPKEKEKKKGVVRLTYIVEKTLERSISHQN